MIPRFGAIGMAGRSLRLAFEAFGLLFPLAFAPSLAMTLATYALTGGPSAPPPPNMLASPAFLGAVAVNVVGGCLLAGALCLVALDAALDRRHSLGDYLRQTGRHAGSLLGLTLLVNLAAMVVVIAALTVGVAIGIAAVLAVYGADPMSDEQMRLGVMLLGGGLAAPVALLPMVYVFARFMPCSAVLLFENEGWSALRRTQALTEGYRWPIVWTSLLVVLALAPLGVVGGTLALMVENNLALSALVDSAFSAIVAAVVAALVAVVYLRLRELKEGVSGEAVAQTIG